MPFNEPSESEWLSYAVGVLLEDPFNNRFSKSRPTLITHHTADDELSNGTVQKLLEALNIKTQTLRAFFWDGY